MTTLPKYSIVLLESSQAQKHVSVNEGFRRLTALTQITVIDRNLITPPVSPADLDTYIPAATATGAWTGAENKLAIFITDQWVIINPWEGATAWVQDENKWIYWDGAGWTDLPFSAPAFSGARVKRATNFSVPSATNTAIQFDAENYDTDSYHDNVTNPSRLTVPSNGFYSIMGGFATETIAVSHAFQFWIAVNGEAFPGRALTGYVTNSSQSGGKGQIICTTLQLTAADYVELWLNQASGAARNLAAGEATFCSITKVG